jgi:6-phosphofructokinase 1
MIKKIGILTSGGDAPGMNAAISGVIRRAEALGIETYVFFDGYKGLIENNFQRVDAKFAANILTRGGTVIGSARLPEFKEESVRKVAVDNLKANGIEALVVIGGDGSYMGAQRLTEMGINCVGIPGTIDNDIASSDFTIGFDTALNTVVEAVERIRDTMESHNRAAVVEVMGNGCGDLVTFAAMATGIDVFSVPESKLSKEEILQQVKLLRDRKKRSVIVAISEKMYPFSADELAAAIEKETGYITRATVLGHIQRGGHPSAMERVLAVQMGVFAVDELAAGHGGVYIGLDGNNLVARDIEKTLKMPRTDRSKLIAMVRQINFEA